jgi:hypothetical protein
MDIGITLSRTAQTIYSDKGYRYTVTASGELNMSKYIFRYMRAPFNYLTNETNDLFDGICSPEQLVSLPVGDPNASDNASLFRLDTLDLVFETQDLADDTWTAIQSDVAVLIDALKQDDTLGDPEDVRIGDS